MSLAGKVILITGASNGIGKACAEKVAAQGASLIINYNHDAESAESLVRSIGHSQAIAVQADAGSLQGITKLVDAAIARFGHIDIVMANAGITIERTVQDTTEDDFDRTFALNVKGPLFLVQRSVPHMRQGSRIVLVSSCLTHFSSIGPSYLLYAAAKGAVEQMTRAMAKELAPKGINVNAIAPGPIATDVFFRDNSEETIAGLSSASPFNRLGQPEDIANIFKFLCSADSAWVAGQTLLASGGLVV
ncbi:hypothetical protein TruAng_002895 [Truncatella angustata]|nr:hypothetical protein TruAng_002895 [Truncatella angustata]